MKKALFLLITATLLVSTNIAHAEKHAVTSISVCTSTHCEAADQKLSTEELLNHLQEILTNNQNENIPMCDADPTTHACKSAKVCHFVLGGIIPGNGCSQSLTFSEISKNEKSTQLELKTSMPLTFIGTPLVCTIASSTLSVNSTTDVVLQLKPHFCSWMAVGAMSAKLTLNIDSINTDTGEIGGYWQHSVKGTGNGSGSGYLKQQRCSS
jgi:hypothetical protein